MKNGMKKSLAGLSAALCLIAGASAAKADVNLNGAGATFPYPIYSKWFAEYNKMHPEIRINYQSIGSGGGVKQFTEKTVDFGASDAPLSDYELGLVKDPSTHIPTVLGAVVLSYNLPEAGSDLKLTGPVIADIFLGNVTKWNDPKIAAVNPGKTLPDTAIVVAHRSDGSGTTYVFTDYLSKVSHTWKGKVGTGKSVSWPAGLGGKGNEGVTGLIKQTPGSIGYIELGYALQNKLPYASVQNKAGAFVMPSIESVSAAAAGVKMPEDYRVSITDPDGKDAYPISAFTYLLVYKKQADGAKGKALVDFLKWAINDGEKLASALYYSPLPDSVAAKVNQTISQISVAP
ncbi:MAG TPA: phosphate ABC transporter substrate-binding protein PstS [bacterium]|nr:phosphate ABC transporter substrate-binding protein PstS [bacterium]